MKKIIIISLSVIVVVTVVFFSSYFIMTAPKYKDDFSINDFTEYIENPNFQTDKNYGKIMDYKSAARAGKNVISERFDDVEGSIFEWMGCDVRHDKTNDAYYIRTYHIYPPMLGGAYGVIIKSDGTVLAIWGEK